MKPLFWEAMCQGSHITMEEGRREIEAVSVLVSMSDVPFMETSVAQRIIHFSSKDLLSTYNV